jgi:hypothetical protein
MTEVLPMLPEQFTRRHIDTLCLLAQEIVTGAGPTQDEFASDRDFREACIETLASQLVDYVYECFWDNCPQAYGTTVDGRVRMIAIKMLDASAFAYNIEYWGR